MNKSSNIDETATDVYTLLCVVVSGCKFKYISYDHKKAMEEYNSSKEYEDVRKMVKNPKSWDVPEKLKNKYKVERVGKLRGIDFNPEGKPWRFYIGNKYAKSYRVEDFGVEVFPLV
jgi:hypothetical protein